MLTLQDVSMVFAQGTADEIRALERVNLTVRDGDFITVIGSNGAGKSTLYNVIAGTYVPTGGRILLTPAEGGPVRDITREREHLRARYIGRIFQNPLLGTAGKMTVEDNMMICHTKGYKGLKISLNNKMRSYFRERLSELNMGLENRLRDNVELLSGGQRQALALLMAVMSKPAILLLDEHTAALDPSNAAMVMDLTRSFTAAGSLTVMMVTHNMSFALETGNRLLMMDAGTIILDVEGEEKSRLTTADLVARFRALKNNDEMMLQ